MAPASDSDPTGASQQATDLAERTNLALLKIIRDNFTSKYVFETPSLTGFRDAVSTHDGTDIDATVALWIYKWLLIVALAITQWEVEVGKHYEPILTTRDGLWRYQLGDVVDIIGFHPENKSPLIEYVGRRSLTIRFPFAQVTDNQLLAALQALSSEDVFRAHEFPGPIRFFDIVS